MPSLLFRSGVRHHLRHPLQGGLAILGIALGVAVVLAVDLALEGAGRAIRASTTAVAGQATHQVVAGSPGVPSEIIASLRLDPQVRAAAPIVEGILTVPALPGRALTVLGVDPLSERAFRPHLAPSGSGFELLQAVGEGGDVVVPESLAGELGVGVGDTLAVQVAGSERLLVVGGVLELPPGPERAGLRDALVMDIATAQILVGRPGRVDRVDLILAEGSAPGPGGQGVASELQERLPAGVRLEPAGGRAQGMEEMMRSFDLNLTAFSLLALLFGAFLIYNTMTFSVVRRRSTLGSLRAVGATRGELLRNILGEALLLGALGTALGLLLGTALGRGLIRLVTRTINDLYFVVSVEGVTLTPGSLIRGCGLGLGVTVLATVPAAREALASTPRTATARSFLEERSGRGVRRAAAWGAVGLLVVVLAVLAPGQGVVAGFFALFAWVVGGALLVPGTALPLLRAVLPGIRRVSGLLGAGAVRGVGRSLSRTGPAMAALAVAVAVTLALGVLVTSFRGSVESWLDRTLSADVYASLPSGVSARPGGTLPPEVVAGLTGASGVEGWVASRGARIPTAEGEVEVRAVEVGGGGAGVDYLMLAGTDDAVDRILQGDEGLLLSEALAFRKGLTVGDSLALLTHAGLRPFPVFGVFRDYGSDRGVAVLARSVYGSHWDDEGVTSVGLHFRDGTGVEEALDRARQSLPPETALSLRSHTELRERTLEVFDRTFRITTVLQTLVFAVAFVGVLGALLALQLERGPELGVLRSLGVTPSQLGWLVLLQTGVMGAVSALLALPLGLGAAGLLVHVVNRRSFGWTVDMVFTPGVVGQALALAFLGSVLAALPAAWRTVSRAPSVVLRGE